jgi:integrase
VTFALALIGQHEDRQDAVLARLEAKLDYEMLVRRGWDPEARMFRPSQDDPLFGFHLCERVKCGRGGGSAPAREAGLCDGCWNVYKNIYLKGHRAGENAVSLEEFRATPFGRHVKPSDDGLCIVCRSPGFERPASAHGLCRCCAYARRRRGVSVAAFVDGDAQHGPAAPRPTFGRCRVAVCSGWAEGPLGLCKGCITRWHRRGRPDLEPFLAEGTWHPLHDGRTATMPPVERRVELELLLGVQQIVATNIRTPMDRLSQAWVYVAGAGVATVGDLQRLPRAWTVRRYLEITQAAARRGATSVEEEAAKDVWDLGVFGIGQRQVLRLDRITQHWLREIARAWAFETLAKRDSQTVRAGLRELEQLCRFLSGLPDGGDDPSALERRHMDEFLFWVRGQDFSQGRRYALVSRVRAVLDFARRRLHEPGQPAAELGSGFRLYQDDVPVRDTPDPDEPGKALPEVILAQLLDEAALAALDAQHPPLRVALELLAHTGRRPSEICNLPADCLHYDEVPAADGGHHKRPVLRYRRFKPPRKTLSLPIHDETAAIIRRQQERLRQRSPEVPLEKLALIPRKQANPYDRLPIAPATFATIMRVWVEALPALLDEDGQVFPKSEIYPYALRHSFAQRMADSGKVSLETLQRIMDHRSPETTQVYYRVRRERVREAFESTAHMTMDHNARMVGAIQAVGETEILRREIGRIPVPLGYCTEPHNVRAVGRHCPFSHQCLGCKHFRTDPSHLEELYAYLERLLETRERLKATAPELDEWARQRAVPSDLEIKKVRNLVRACEEALEELAPHERQHLEELFRVLRGTRARMDDALPIETVAGVQQPEPTFVPPPFNPIAKPTTNAREAAA